MDYLSELREMVTAINNRKDIVTKQMPKGLQGSLSSTIKRGKRVIYIDSKQDGKRSRHIITDDVSLQMQFALKEACKEELRQLIGVNNMIVCMAQEITRLCGTGEFNRQEFLTSRYPWLPKEVIRQACIESEDADGWANEPFDQTMFKSEFRTKLTSRGLYVRSKSEVLIAEKLYEFGLPFRYEQSLQVDGYDLAPDFTIRRADGKIMYWEHEGLTSSQKYTDWQLKKHALYASIDIVPWDNLILTYDSINGDIDLRIIEAEIKNKLVI